MAVRYVDAEAMKLALNDPRLPEQGKGNEVERRTRFVELYQEHFNAVLEDAKKKGDKIMVLQV